MRRWLLSVILVWLALLAIVYVGDYCVVRYKLPHGRNPFGQVTVQPVYVIHEKSGKIEYQFADPETDACVRSLFPHMGYSPCWYLKRHTEKQINI
jgi:hypothetical protein